MCRWLVYSKNLSLWDSECCKVLSTLRTEFYKGSIGFASAILYYLYKDTFYIIAYLWQKEHDPMSLSQCIISYLQI